MTKHNAPVWKRNRNDEDEWLVFIPGDTLPIGSIVTVGRRDGTESSVILAEFIYSDDGGHLYRTKTTSREDRANLTIIHEINKETKSAQFTSKRTGEIYDTTLHSCTCPDYLKRRLPCKHMHRLSSELGENTEAGDTKKRKGLKKLAIALWSIVGFLLFILVIALVFSE